MCSPILTPQCCGVSMLRLSDPDEIPPGGRCWRCCVCQRQQVELARPLPPRCLHDSVWRCIRPRHRRFEVRIAGGRSGVHFRIGLFVTLAEAVRARDQAEAARQY